VKAKERATEMGREMVKEREKATVRETAEAARGRGHRNHLRRQSGTRQ